MTVTVTGERARTITTSKAFWFVIERIADSCMIPAEIMRAQDDDEALFFFFPQRYDEAGEIEQVSDDCRAWVKRGLESGEQQTVVLVGGG